MRTIMTLTTAGTAALALGACSATGGAATEVDMSTDRPFLLEGVSGLTQVAQLTGPGSELNDTEAVAVAGTDLGSMVNLGDRTYFLFGDTFGTRDPDSTGGQGGNWRSNAVAWTTDDDPSDGITFDGWVLDDIGLADEVVPGRHESNGTGEVTKIPTYGFAVEDTLYLHFMSVHLWGEPGHWDANYAALARSTDQGQTWEVVEGVEWPGGSGFVQVATAQVTEDGEDFVYLWGIPGGRFGGVQLMKVPAAVDAVEDPDAYRYFTGVDDDGAPQWTADPAAAVTVVDDTVGELSVMHHEQLDRWLMTYLREGTGVVIREGLTPWGPWDDAMDLVPASEYPGLYGPYLNPRYVSEDGRTVYFALSLWDPYNVFWFSADLKIARP